MEEVINLQEQLRQAMNDIVRALVAAEEAQEGAILGHADRVASCATAIGNQLGISGEALVTLRQAAALHDVGKIAVDRKIAAKFGKLTDDELRAMQLHAILAERILEKIEGLHDVLPAVRHHHERWDGTGYPAGLKGEEIPLGARIIAVAETFDFLTTPLNWRETMDPDEASAEIWRCSGTQFDPAVVEAFVKIQPLISFVH
jgi:HD-GYP domain-containing protein (c-di-GMP phosphodiesterase class II)